MTNDQKLSLIALLENDNLHIARVAYGITNLNEVSVTVCHMGRISIRKDGVCTIKVETPINPSMLNPDNVVSSNEH